MATSPSIKPTATGLPAIVLLILLTLVFAGSLCAQAPPEKQFYIEQAGQPAGPFGMEQLKQRQANGTLTAETLAWTEGMADWQPASQVSALASLFQAIPPPMPNQQPMFDRHGTPTATTSMNASQLNKSATEFLVGQWRASGMLPVEGFGPSDAEVTVTYRPDGSFDIRGQYRVREPSAGIVPIDVQGQGHWETPIEERNPDSNHLRGALLNTNGSLTMTLPSHFGVPPQTESLSDSGQIQIIDENSVRDAEGIVWQRLH